MSIRKRIWSDIGDSLCAFAENQPLSWPQHMCHAKQYLQVNQPFGESTMRWRRGEEEKIHMQLLISCNAIFMHRMKSQIHIQRIVACG